MSLFWSLSAWLLELSKVCNTLLPFIWRIILKLAVITDIKLRSTRLLTAERSSILQNDFVHRHLRVQSIRKHLAFVLLLWYGRNSVTAALLFLYRRIPVGNLACKYICIFDWSHEYFTKQNKQQHRCKKDDVVQTKAYIWIITKS